MAGEFARGYGTCPNCGKEYGPGTPLGVERREGKRMLVHEVGTRCWRESRDRWR
jgi:hypothetical protein